MFTFMVPTFSPKKVRFGEMWVFFCCCWHIFCLALLLLLLLFLFLVIIANSISAQFWLIINRIIFVNNISDDCGCVCVCVGGWDVIVNLIKTSFTISVSMNTSQHVCIRSIRCLFSLCFGFAETPSPYPHSEP